MEKQEIKKEFKKFCVINADKRILIFRHGIRYYLYPRKGKILPICS